MNWFQALPLDEQQRLIVYESVRQKEEAQELELLATSGLTKKAM